MERKKTYREIFGGMPPKKHDKELEKSEVIEWILFKMVENEFTPCSMDEAYRIFGVINNKRKSRILIYRASHGDWVGCDTEDAWKYRFNEMENALLSVQKDIKTLFELVGSTR